MGLSVAEPRMSSDSRSRKCDAEEQRRWLAAYTRARHESVVAEQFKHKGFDALLPTYRRFTRWSDRIRQSDAPLFPSYVFVRVSGQEHARILQTTGVVRIVCCAGRPVPLSDADVEKLQLCTAHPSAIEPYPYLRVGQRVRVKHGPFQGLEGLLVEKKNATRLVITVEHILKSVSLDLSGADVEALG